MTKKIYWKGVEQLTNDPEFVKNADKEFPEHLPIKDAYGDNSGEESGDTRRDFLKKMGFSLAAVSLAACEAPVKKAIPYLNKPENVDPGVPNYYASTFINGSEAYPIVVKTREGRPIFVEGNTFSSVTRGGASARAHASVISLYDVEKIQYPTKGGKKVSWKELDKEVISGLGKAGKTVVVSHSIVSPSTKIALNAFADKYNAEVVTYDQETVSAMIEANKAQFGKAVVPSYSFDKANVIVSFGADFHNNWVAGVEHTAQYTPGRKVGPNKKEMSQHFQFESMLTITGSSADYRTPVKPSEEGLYVAALYNEVAKATGNTAVKAPAVKAETITKAAKALLKAKGKSLVVSGINNVAVQQLVNGINQMLDNYGKTLDLNNPSFTKQGSDKAMTNFINDLKSGRVGSVVFYNTNPVYDHPRGAEIAEAIKKAKLSVATADRLNETASLCTYNAPDTHYLEAWNDAEVKKGFFSLGQPTISKIFDTRQAQDSFLTWAGDVRSYEEIIKTYWKENLFPLQSKEATFDKFWVRSLHNGVLEVASTVSVHESSDASVDYTSSFDVDAAGQVIRSKYKKNNEGIELVVFAPTLIGNGAMANNPMLQETPDPITKVTWGNYVAISQALAKELFSAEEFETKKNVVAITINGNTIELPAIVQPGLKKNVIAIPYGYGRGEGAGRVAAEAGGVNAFAFAGSDNGFVDYNITSGIEVKSAGRQEQVAQTQTHETIMARESIIQETTLAEYVKNPAAARHEVKISSYNGEKKPTDISLWDIQGDGYKNADEKAAEIAKKPATALLWNERIGFKSDVHEYNNHHWGLAIDLNACNGCNACVVACHTENNVPVVGKEEVINRREMHWLRIDRYYAHEEADVSMPDDYMTMERALENPEVVFQPMMCQHCNNAPCETVCPVAATTHSTEGLNQMTYNRCIGTKYCANNCPYKVRRFNWFKYHNNNEFNYHMNNDLGKMVLNPDVTVRSRGVMEKCSMCVQRIQAGKLKAKTEGREMRDGDATTACAASCTAGAIQFGDLNDSNSNVRKLLEGELEERAYNVLDEINVRPNVYYLAKVRNKDASKKHDA
ncbi:TAT-variant-translocated molybdopterin oxidoreductase [Sediminitomix flava]|uniref:Quinol:cytochrome c oxidoreductase iron-sulfur protein n=1 Tax=Sediminitomix flava TaxID=379075 RepID=A0A315ZCS4_SEDFL|nr:TAT-variant-translocated molybdopterin oxidoreductase [Sediminitomix flava]PWJ43110.1 quinol:cytochrome c oxidoreductase iron-sulfur protein precursor [Sediminitomix flava]